MTALRRTIARTVVGLSTFALVASIYFWIDGYRAVFKP